MLFEIDLEKGLQKRQKYKEKGGTLRTWRLQKGLCHPEVHNLSM